MSRSARPLIVHSSLLLTLASVSAVYAQEVLPASDPLLLVPTWDVARHQPHDAPIAFTLSRPMRGEDGRLAVVVGHADLSVLLQVSGTQVFLPLRGERLASGDLEIVVYVVAPSLEWRELGRFALRRLTRGGFESENFKPKLDLQSDGQLSARPPPGTPALTPGVHQDLALSGGVDATYQRNGSEWGVQTLLTGASRTLARLRAAQMGPNAPLVDLASYNIRLTRSRLGLALGHVGFGNHRFIANQFRSRGITAEARLSRAIQATLAGAAGSEIVGWDDPFGLRRPSHRILTGSLGIEAAPSRPGLLRLDFTMLEGSLQPISAFNQGSVTDREESGGMGAQVAAALPSNRIRLVAGIARSRFNNPADPLVSGELELVPLREEQRNARFGELTVDALRGGKVIGIPTTLTLAARHERVDPQYRSVAAFVQADRAQNSIEANAALGPLQLQARLMRARDNLDDVPSLLITHTRGRTINAALPLAGLVQASPAAWWWPALSLAWQSVHQFGGDTPENGGFRFVFQVPDQLTSNLTLGAMWQRSEWNLAWRHNYSLVDNRQPERERSDFATHGYGATLGLTASTRLTVGLDLFRETMHNLELAQHTRSDRLSLQTNWRPFNHTAFSGTYSLVKTDDQTATQRARNAELRIEGSQGFNLYSRPEDGSQARVFVRYGRASSALRAAGAIQPDIRHWSLHGGLSLRVF